MPVFQLVKAGSVLKTVLPLATALTKRIQKTSSSDVKALVGDLEKRFDNKFSDMESALRTFDFDQVVDKVRSMDPIRESRQLAIANKALEAEIDDLRAQLAEAIKPQRKGLGAWWFLIVFLTCGLGLFVAAAWWLYGSDDDDLFDEFDDFSLLNVDRDIPQARAASEEAKANADRIVNDIATDETIQLS